MSPESDSRKMSVGIRCLHCIIIRHMYVRVVLASSWKASLYLCGLTCRFVSYLLYTPKSGMLSYSEAHVEMRTYQSDPS